MSNPRRIRAALSIAVALVVLVILWQARVALLPFMVGVVLAIILMPLVDLVARLIRFRSMSDQMATQLAIGIVYLAAAGIIAGLSVLFVPMAADNIESLFERREIIYADIAANIVDFIAFYEENAPEFLKDKLQNAITTFGEGIDGVVTGSAGKFLSVVTDSFAVIAGFIVIPFWLIYVIKDRGTARDSFYRLFPEHWRNDVAIITTHSVTLLGRFIRVQLLLGVIVGTSSWIGLTLLGVQAALPLAIVLGITELIVIIGPIIGGAIAVLVTLALDPGWTVLWVLLLVIGIQQFENIVLVPRLQGAAIHMHPAVVIVLLVIAGQVFGLLGLLVALPLTAILRDTFLHIHRRLGEEEEQPREPLST